MTLFTRLATISTLFLLALTASAQLELVDVRRQNLGGAINTASIEILPIVSPDGSTLYFDRKFDTGNVGGVTDQDDIYFSTRLNDSVWSPAMNIGAPLNTPGSDVLFWIAPDGNTALVHNGGLVGGKPIGMALARRKLGKWETPARLHIDGVKDFGESYYAQITPDRKHLILAYAPDPKQPRDLDLFVCRAISSDLIRWSRPVNLGQSINTSGFDGAPFIAADARSLYFASDGRGGMGSSDLYVSRRLDTGWTNWSQPTNLGGSINTPLFDASISIPADGRAIYVSGAGFIDETSFGKADIYLVPLPERFRPAAIATIDGQLLAQGRGTRGLVRAERVDDGREVASTVSGSDGSFTFSLPGGSEYRLTGGADGYTEGRIVVDARKVTSPTSLSATIELDAGALDPDSGPAPTDSGIYFDVGSSALGPRALAGLDRALVSLLRDQGRELVSKISVVGNTDDVGTSENNTVLSRQRAESVRDWLIANGINAQSISVVANGEWRPVAPNTSAEGRARNRRVDVLYIGLR